MKSEFEKMSRGELIQGLKNARLEMREAIELNKAELNDAFLPKAGLYLDLALFVIKKDIANPDNELRGHADELGRVYSKILEKVLKF